jgi:hypothetical protein
MMNYWVIPGLMATFEKVTRNDLRSIWERVKQHPKAATKSRKAELVHDRAVFYYLCAKYRDERQLTLQELAGFLHQNHSTVLHHYRQVSRRMEVDKAFASAVTLMQNQIFKPILIKNQYGSKKC